MAPCVARRIKEHFLKHFPNLFLDRGQSYYYWSSRPTIMAEGESPSHTALGSRLKAVSLAADVYALKQSYGTKLGQVGCGGG